MKDSIKTKKSIYVRLIILFCLSIMVSCDYKENSNHIPNKGSNPPEAQPDNRSNPPEGQPNKESSPLEEQPTPEALEKLYGQIGMTVMEAVSHEGGIYSHLQDKSRLNKSKEELYTLRSENKITEEYLEKDIERISRELETLEEKQKQVEEKFSTKIRHLSLENPKIKLSRKRLDFGGFNIIRLWKDAEETTEDKEAYQKIEDEVQKYFELIE